MNLHILLLALLSASSDGQFDLLCSGSIVGTATNTAATNASFTRHYRVDIHAGRYCSDTCSETGQLASIDSGSITFFSIDKPKFSTYETVSRETGRFWGESIAPEIGSKWTMDGYCVKVEFSGFPQRQF